MEVYDWSKERNEPAAKTLLERRVDCHSARIRSLEDRMAFCAKLTMVAIALSIIAVAMAAVF